MQLAIQARVLGDQDLKDTIILANKACQEIIDAGLAEKTFNKTRLHHLTYRAIRQKYPRLNSSIITAIRDQASDMLKRLKLENRPVKKNTSSIRLNHNTFKLFTASKEVSLSTLNGRKKYCIKIPSYFEKYSLTESTSARIRLCKDKVIIDIVIDAPTKPNHKINTVLGVDRGIYNPAVTSSNQFFNSRKLRQVKGKYRHNKACLQRAGTRSAKRHLQKISGRERRFIADTNHCISKTIVNTDCDAIAIEELNVAAMKMRIVRLRRTSRKPTVFDKKRAKGGKKLRSLMGSWSPTQLVAFIKYKAELLGRPVLLVNSHYTSQACSACGDIRRANRNGRLFKCCVCGFQLHSDLNAARNIALLAKGKLGRLTVNQPIVACDDLKASLKEELRASIVTSSTSQMRSN